VSIGLNEQDAFFALGVAPVGVTDWMGFEHGIGPWAETAAKAAGDPPELLTNTDGIQFEKVAALRPDVIVALYSDLKRSDDEKLSQFAGRTASMAMSFEGIWVYGPEDPRSRLLTDLGFELSPEISKLFVKDYAGMISEEQVQLLDLDAVAWFAPRTRRGSSRRRTACTPASTSTRRAATSSCSTPARTTRTTPSARRRS
jgi:ABC-type Fe3+-hydroxamate transport system substrate-binding protein